MGLLLALCGAVFIQEEDISTLLRLLDSKEPVISAHAEEALLDLGSRAIPHLERAEKDAAPEKRDRLRRILKDIREFEAGLEGWETDRLPDLLKKLDDRALVLQKRFARREGGPAHVAAIIEREHAFKLGAPDPYVLATFSFEFGTRDDVKLVLNDWDFVLSGGRIWVRTVVDDRSEIWDLGETDFDKPELGKWGDRKESVVLEARKARVYVIHTNDANSNLWSKMKILERRAGEWILFRWERVVNPVDLMNFQRRPERLMKSGRARLQIKSGHGGGNPTQVFLDGGKNAYLDRMTDRPMEMDGRIDEHESGAGFVEGGLIPMGKVWILRRAQIKATIHDDGQFRLLAKGQGLASLGRKAGDSARSLDETWKGRIVVRPGEERTIFVEASYYSQADVALFGALWDERFADEETLPELTAAEKEKAEALLKSLDSEEIEARELGVRKLVEWGPPILKYLQGVDASKRSSEFQARLKDAIRQIDGD